MNVRGMVRGIATVIVAGLTPFAVAAAGIFLPLRIMDLLESRESVPVDPYAEVGDNPNHIYFECDGEAGTDAKFTFYDMYVWEGNDSNAAVQPQTVEDGLRATVPLANGSEATITARVDVYRSETLYEQNEGSWYTPTYRVTVSTPNAPSSKIRINDNGTTVDSIDFFNDEIGDVTLYRSWARNGTIFAGSASDPTHLNIPVGDNKALSCTVSTSFDLVN